MFAAAKAQNPPLSYFGPSFNGESKKKRKKKQSSSREISVRIGKKEKTRRATIEQKDERDLTEEEIRQEVNTLLRGFFINTDEERFLSDVNNFLRSVAGNVGVPVTEAWAGGISGGLEGLVALALEQMRIRGVFALFGRREFSNQHNKPVFRKQPKTKDVSHLTDEERAFKGSQVSKRIGVLLSEPNKGAAEDDDFKISELDKILLPTDAKSTIESDFANNLKRNFRKNTDQDTAQNFIDNYESIRNSIDAKSKLTSDLLNAFILNEIFISMVLKTVHIVLSTPSFPNETDFYVKNYSGLQNLLTQFLEIVYESNKLLTEEKLNVGQFRGLQTMRGRIVDAFEKFINSDVVKQFYPKQSSAASSSDIILDPSVAHDVANIDWGSIPPSEFSLSEPGKGKKRRKSRDPQEENDDLDELKKNFAEQAELFRKLSEDFGNERAETEKIRKLLLKQEDDLKRAQFAEAAAKRELQETRTRGGDIGALEARVDQLSSEVAAAELRLGQTKEFERKSYADLQDIQTQLTKMLSDYSDRSAQLAKRTAELADLESRESLRKRMEEFETLGWLVDQINKEHQSGNTAAANSLFGLLQENVIKAIRNTLESTRISNQPTNINGKTILEVLNEVKTKIDEFAQKNIESEEELEWLTKDIDSVKESLSKSLENYVLKEDFNSGLSSVRTDLQTELNTGLSSVRNDLQTLRTSNAATSTQLAGIADNLENNIHRMVDEYLQQKRQEAEQGLAASSGGELSQPGTSLFGNLEEIARNREDESFKQQKKELSDARAKLAVASRTLEVATERLAKQTKDAKDDERKIADLRRATESIEKRTAELDVRKRDIELRDSMLQLQRNQQLSVRLRGGDGRTGRSERVSDDSESGDIEYDEARRRGVEIDLQRKMIELQAARRRMDESPSASSRTEDTSERLFVQRKRELELEKMRAEIQSTLATASRANQSSGSSSSRMIDDDPEDRAYLQRKRELELRKMEADLQNTLGSRAAASSSSSSKMVDDPDNRAYLQRKRELELRKMEADLQNTLAGTSSKSGSSSKPQFADPEEIEFLRQERDIKIRKMEADLQEKLLAVSTKQEEANLRKAKPMEDDPDPQKAIDEKEKRQLDLEKSRAQLHETMVRLANEKRKADNEEKRDEAIVDILEFEQTKRKLDLQKLQAQVDKLVSESDPDTLRQIRQYEKEKRDAERRKMNSETSRTNLRALRAHEQEKREFETEDWQNKLSKAQEDLAKARQDLSRAQARDASGFDLLKLKLEVDRAQAQVAKQVADNQKAINLEPLEREKLKLENDLASLRVKKQQYELDNAEADRNLQKAKIDAEEKKLDAAVRKAKLDSDLQRDKLEFDKQKNRDDANYNRRKHALEIEKLEQQNKRQRLDYENAARKYRREAVLPARDIRAVYDMLTSKDGTDVAQVRSMLAFIGITDLKSDRVLFERFISEPFVAAIQYALSNAGGTRKLTLVGILSRERLVHPFVMVVADAYRYNAVNNNGYASVLAIQQSARKLGVSISKFKSVSGGSMLQEPSRPYKLGLLADMVN